MAIMVSSGSAATLGILIKDATSLEVPNKINTVILDKTGTLTKAKLLVVTDILRWYIANCCECGEFKSEHSLAYAIINKAKEENLELLDVKNFKAIPGHGVWCRVNDKKTLFGSRKLMTDNKIDTEEWEEKIINLENQTTMILSVDNEILGLIAVADVLKRNPYKR